MSGDFDAVVLLGGNGGAERLGSSEPMGQILARQWKAGGIVATICAAPTALAKHGIAKGRRATSHHGVRATLREHFRLSDERVVEDGQLVTSQGPGTSFEFALHLVSRLQGDVSRLQGDVSRLQGDEVAAKVSAPMVLK